MQDDETGGDADPGAEGGSDEVTPEVSEVSEAGGAPELAEAGGAAEDGGAGEDGPRGRRRGRLVVYAVVVLAAAGLGSAAAVGLTSNPGTPVTGVSSHQVPGPQNNQAGGGSLRTAAVAAKVDPGVVDVDADIAYSGGTSSEGTGMVISQDGLILTNNHVINGSNSIKVTLVTRPGAKPFVATVVGYDSTQDVALLKINAKGLRPVAVGNSSQVTVGTAVVALGNAEGQGGRPRAAAGTINSLNKTISPTDESTGDTETLHNMLQTDADIVSGDSGGPMANGAGQVIGMTTANASSSQSSSSVLGYAIPINTALAVAHQIAAGQQGGTVQIGVPGFLGVLVPQSNSSNPQQQAAQQRQQEQQQSQQGSGPGAGGGNAPGGSGGCAAENSDTSVPAQIAPAHQGALVDGVLCQTPAVKANLAAGDVITSVDGQPVTTPGSLTQAMEGYRPGVTVTLGWQTPTGQHRTGRVVLSAAPAK